jgi:hypothetical protein
MAGIEVVSGVARCRESPVLDALRRLLTRHGIRTWTTRGGKPRVRPLQQEDRLWRSC